MGVELDLSGIGTWAGDKGPYVGIILAQWGIILRLLNRFFVQQDLTIRAMRVADKTLDKSE